MAIILCKHAVESFGLETHECDKAYGEYFYFSTEEEGLEGVDFLLMWKKNFLKKIHRHYPSMELVSQSWTEKEEFGSEPATLILRLGFNNTSKEEDEKAS